MDFVRSPKELDVFDIIDAGVKTMVDFGTNDMMPHFIYCFYSFVTGINGLSQDLKRIILKKMRKYGIQSLILTVITMSRVGLITKEKAKKAAKKAAEGKLKNDPDWKLKESGLEYNGSINDDLDSFINNHQNSNEVEDEDIVSFCTPKLTKEELKLVEEKNEEYMMTFVLELDADVDVKEMKKSDSKDKYVKCFCRRKTIHLNS